MFDFSKVRWEFVLDKVLQVSRLGQQILGWGSCICVVAYGLYRAYNSQTLAEQVLWVIGGMLASIVLWVLYLLIDLGYHFLDKVSDWLTEQLTQFPKIRYLLLVPLAVGLSAIPMIVVYSKIVWGTPENILAVIIFVVSLLLSSTITSFLKEDKKRREGNRLVLDDELLLHTPLLSGDDYANAIMMARLYMIFHCYENSVRRLVANVLSKELGENWWDEAASDDMKRNVESTKRSEQRRRWLSSRGEASPLYYLTWSDLEKLITKYSDKFTPYIGELRFIQSRFGDLASLRNIVAHNGTLPSEDDFQRAELSFRDWKRQVGKHTSASNAEMRGW